MSDRRKVLDLFEAQKDYMDSRVEHGIELYRKGFGYITVKDAEGNVIPNAQVKVKLKNHEFRFGANIFMLDELETPEKNEAYKKHFAELFNMATLPFYWDATEPEEGKIRYAKGSSPLYRRPPIDLCMEFCEEHGIEPREHALCFEQFFPKWVEGKPTPEVKKLLKKRYAEIAERYADRINTIEVTNEMFWYKPKTEFYNDPEFITWCFKLAEQYFPNNQLVINEATPFAWEENARFTDRYFAYIENAMFKGARIDAIGMQFHHFTKKENEYDTGRQYYSPERLYLHLDHYATLGKPLQITEVTLPAYSWEPEDEEIQAKLIENLYSIWFSHPNVEQIIYWNLVDGYAHVWDPDPEKIKASQGKMDLGENYYHGGLFRFDLTPKAAYYTIRHLIKEKWHTEETLTADGAGKAHFKGFYGDYDVEITANGKTVTKELNLHSKNRTNEYTFSI